MVEPAEQREWEGLAGISILIAAEPGHAQAQSDTYEGALRKSPERPIILKPAFCVRHRGPHLARANFMVFRGH